MSCVSWRGRWAWFPGGGIRSAPFSPPTSDGIAFAAASAKDVQFLALCRGLNLQSAVMGMMDVNGLHWVLAAMNGWLFFDLFN